MTDRLESIDQELRRFGAGLGRPTLSPEFGRLLHRRLAQEKQLQRTARRRLRLMQAYWLIASAVSLLILRSWWGSGQSLSLAEVVTVGVGLALLALPVAMLLRGLRIGLLDLVFGTLDGLTGPCGGRPEEIRRGSRAR